MRRRNGDICIGPINLECFLGFGAPTYALSTVLWSGLVTVPGAAIYTAHVHGWVATSLCEVVNFAALSATENGMIAAISLVPPLFLAIPVGLALGFIGGHYA